MVLFLRDRKEQGIVKIIKWLKCQDSHVINDSWIMTNGTIGLKWEGSILKHRLECPVTSGRQVNDKSAVNWCRKQIPTSLRYWSLPPSLTASMRHSLIAPFPGDLRFCVFVKPGKQVQWFCRHVAVSPAQQLGGMTAMRQSSPLSLSHLRLNGPSSGGRPLRYVSLNKPGVTHSEKNTTKKILHQNLTRWWWWWWW